MDHDINSQDFFKRLQQGKYEAEVEIFGELKKIYGDRIQPADEWNDIFGKTDVILDGKKSSIKDRKPGEFSGNDLLSCIAEPYTGKDSLMTGRDSGEYDRIFCRNKTNTKIRDFDGQWVNAVIWSAVREYKATNSDLLKLPGQVFPTSMEYDGWQVQLRSFRDAKNKRLKVCCFIPEEYAKHFGNVNIIDLP